MTRAAINPFAGWLRCEECGTDAGAPCYGDDDKPAVEVCDGRAFRVRDSADRTRRAKSEDGPLPPKQRQAPEVRRARNAEHQRAKRLRAQARVPPTYVACTHCHAPVRLTGIAKTMDHVYCSQKECRKAYDREWHVKHVGPLVQHKCWWCGVPLSPSGRSRTSKRPICDATECRLAKGRQEDSERRARRRAERSDRRACDAHTVSG